MAVNEFLLLGTRKGLFVLRHRGGSWRITQRAFLGVSVSAVLSDARDGALYAALVHGQFGVKLHRSDDGGKQWTEIAAPAFPRSRSEDAKAKRAPAVSQVWCLEAAGSDMPGTLWAGTIPGALFRSDDRGVSWHLNRSLWRRPERDEWFGGGSDEPGLHSICIDPRDSTVMAVAVSVGGVWRSQNAGRSWTLCGHGQWADYMPPNRREDLRIQDVHRLAQCRAQPHVFWLQHHNAVFRSADALASCHELVAVRPSRYGFAVVAHPTDPNTAWFAPMTKDEARYPVNGTVVVARTRDGGETFEILRRGLPQRDAYDLVYRHALDTNATGRYLAMGSTTGSLWLSENQGDSWNCILPHLPPIYCVRFA